MLEEGSNQRADVGIVIDEEYSLSCRWAVLLLRMHYFFNFA
jgi:hypothetical protein